jgi:hypothetical protein
LEDRHKVRDKPVSCCSLNAAAQFTRLLNVSRIAEFDAAGFLGRECGFGPLRDEPAFFLGLSSVEMQHERVGIAASRHKSSVVYNKEIIDRGPEVYGAACRMGLEGIVSKHVLAPYLSGKVKSWLKIKIHRRQRCCDCRKNRFEV